ncbi:MAG: cytochrome c family protein [Anaerolineales bacterium]|nr:cytochrome c family protein [Anaerolineales bacterium]
MNVPAASPPSDRSFPTTRLLAAFLLVLSLAVIAGIMWTRAQALAAPDQPIAYSHQVHIGAGVQCLYCHSGALRASSAGIPSVEKCLGCHAVIAREEPEIQAVAAYAAQGEGIPWVRVNSQPDFVFFSHQPHLAASLNCETCHGDVSRMGVARPVVRMDMGWCLECHLDQPEEKVARLADCVTCHK